MHVKIKSFYLKEKKDGKKKENRQKEKKESV